MTLRISSSSAQPAAGARPGWLRRQLPQNMGSCYADRLELGAGFALVHSAYSPFDALAEENTVQHQARMLVITLGLSGASQFEDADGAMLGFQAGYTTVTAFQRSQGERRYAAGAIVSQLRLLVGEDLLQRYVGEEAAERLFGAQGLHQLLHRKTPREHMAAARVLADSHDVLDTHIGALTLLANQLRSLAPAPQEARLTPQDVAKLEQVHTLMQQQMAHSLTVEYLCAATGLNEFKLKRGLRQLYNTSPHRLLTELRMREAWRLLEGGSQVAQAAYRVGYQHPANFSAAFTRFFGRTPKSVFGPRG